MWHPAGLSLTARRPASQILGSRIEPKCLGLVVSHLTSHTRNIFGVVS